jgi:hypothetical protein
MRRWVPECMSAAECGMIAKSYVPNPPGDANHPLVHPLHLPSPHLRPSHHKRTPSHRYRRLHRSVLTTLLWGVRIVILMAVLDGEEREEGPGGEMTTRSRSWYESHTSRLFHVSAQSQHSVVAIRVTARVTRGCGCKRRSWRRFRSHPEMGSAVLKRRSSLGRARRYLGEAEPATNRNISGVSRGEEKLLDERAYVRNVFLDFGRVCAEESLGGYGAT